MVSYLLQALKNLGAGNDMVVICDVLSSPAHLILDLSANPSFFESFVVTHVISVLEPAIVYPWSSVRHPLALSRAYRGWITAALVQDYKQTGFGLAVREWNALAKRCLHDMKASLGSSAAFQKPPTGRLIDGPLQELPASVALRSLSLPGSCDRTTQGSWAMCNPAHNLLGIFIAATAPFDLQALRESCNEVFKLAVEESCPLAGNQCGAAWNGLFCIEAHVSGVEDGQALWALPTDKLRSSFQAGQAMPSFRMVLTARGEVAAPAHWSPPLSESTGLIWWWCIPKGEPAKSEQLRAEAKEVVEASYLQPPLPSAPWSRADVPREQVARMEEEARAAGVPEGSFSDGTYYMDCNGIGYGNLDGQGRSREHPGFAPLVEAFVAQHNAEVEQKNKVICEIAALPIFSAP